MSPRALWLLPGVMACSPTWPAAPLSPADERQCEATVEEPPSEDFQAVDFAPSARSLRVRRSIVVRSSPDEGAQPLGTLAQDMRVTWKRAVAGGECPVWVEVEPRGWICSRYLEENFREPRVRELPRVDEGELTPGVYARVVGRGARLYPSASHAARRRGGSPVRGVVTVQLDREVKLGRRQFWKTTSRQYVEAKFLRRYEPSDFSGIGQRSLEDLGLPLAWAQARGKRAGLPVTVRAAPGDEAEPLTFLPARTLVRVVDRSADGQWLSIAPGEWINASELHLAELTPPPIGSSPTERWIDVNLDQQVLVAYEGERPVFATLVSSGSRGHETPEGLFRIWIKFAQANMTSSMGEPDYQVNQVPWTMYFHNDFALHTAYWHDRFGEPASHGCLNLAPQDARTLYGWTAPEVPLGWSMSYATSEQPGTLVRVRSERWLSPLLPASFVLAEGGSTDRSSADHPTGER